MDDLLDRIQANLDEQIGEGFWKIYSRNKDRSVQRGALESEWLSVYGEKTEDNVIESMSITVDLNGTQAAIRAGYSEKTAYNQSVGSKVNPITGNLLSSSHNS